MTVSVLHKHSGMGTIKPVIDQQSSTDFNQRVGANVQRLRKAAGLAQADLASQLVERGLSFQQPTILKVEKGSRPLKFEEACAIADILGISPAALTDYTRDQARAAAAVDLQVAMADIAERKQRIAALEEALAAQRELLEHARWFKEDSLRRLGAPLDAPKNGQDADG